MYIIKKLNYPAFKDKDNDVMKFYCLLFALFLIILTSCERDNTEIIKNPYERGLSFASEGKFEKAEDAFKRALNNDIDTRAAQGSLGVVEDVLSKRLDQKAAINFFKGIKHANKGQMIEAYSYLSKAIKIDPAFADAYYERGSVNGRLKLYEKAVSDFTKAADLNPNDAEAYNNRGLAYAKGMKKYDMAITDFNRAIGLNPEFAEAYDNRGIAYRIKDDNKEKACSDWKKACELDRCNSFNLAKQNGYCE
jgi:tetratricopeptide (TPR) repeat protein